MRHLRGHVVEQRRAEPEALGVTVDHRVAPVDDQRRPGVLAGPHVADDPVAVGAGDQRAHVAAPPAVARAQRSHPLGDPGDQRLGDVAHGHHHRDRHAPLAGRPEPGVHGGVGSEVEVRVRQDHHVVLGAAEGLDALAVAGPGLVDVLGDRGRADERDRLHVRVGQQRVDRHPVPVHDVVHAVGEPGLPPELSDEVRRTRVLLTRLDDHRVARCDGDRVEPHGHHSGEVERRDDAHDPERLAHGVYVDTGGDPRRVAPLEQVRYAARELDHLEAAGHLAQCVGQDLAVLGGDDRGELPPPLVEQLAEGEQDLGPPGQRRGAPVGEGRPRRLHRLLHDLDGREVDRAAQRSSGGIE